VWYRYSKAHLIDTFDMAKQIADIIDSNIKTIIDKYYLDKFENIYIKQNELENEANKLEKFASYEDGDNTNSSEPDAYAQAYFEKNPNAIGSEEHFKNFPNAPGFQNHKSNKNDEHLTDQNHKLTELNDQYKKQQDNALVYYMIIQPKLKSALEKSTQEINQLFKDIENFPDIQLFFDMGEKFVINGAYNDEINRLDINTFNIVCNQKNTLIATVAHELAHWKQKHYNPQSYIKSIDKLQPNLKNQKIYLNNQFERQAYLNTIIQELANFKFDSSSNFDKFLEQSPTWSRIKKLLYKENIIQMKINLYKYFTN
jgi:hypothetical protein